VLLRTGELTRARNGFARPPATRGPARFLLSTHH
jgi:hypothetical protein